MDDLISRQAAIDMAVSIPMFGRDVKMVAVSEIKNLPSAQPEITEEQAIEHLQSTGWMQNHDREMYDMGLKKQLADDSGSYDSLLPSAQPEPCEDAVSRADAFNAINDYVNTVGVLDGYTDTQEVLRIVKRLPSVQPEPSIVRCEDCRFRHKSPDWKHRQSMGDSIWYCGKNRGINFAETVELDDFCSSAERRTDEPD